MSDSSAPQGRGRQRLLVVLAALFGVLFVAGTWLVPADAREFAYYPVAVEPWPWASARGFTVEQVAHHLLSLLLGVPLVAMLARIFATTPAFRVPSAAELKRLVGLGLASSLAGVGVVMFAIFRGRATVDDELAYAVQARLLSEFRLGHHDVPALFIEPMTIPSLAGWTEKYLFGEPLVQVPGVLVGIPALLHLPLAALTLYAVARATTLLCGEAAGRWAPLLVALSPMFVLTSASGQSEPTSLAGLALALWGLALARTGAATLGAALSGTGVGLALAARVQSGGPVGLVLIAATVWAIVQARRWGALLVGAATLTPWLAAIAAYNQRITGSVFKLPWFLTRLIEHYGFGQVWANDSFRHTPLTGLENLLTTAVRLGGWWLGWPLGLWLAWRWWRGGGRGAGARLWFAMLGAQVVFNFFYYCPGMGDTGPLYYYEALLPLAGLGSMIVAEAFERESRQVMAILAAGLVAGTAPFAAQVTARLGRLVEAIHADTDVVIEQLPAQSLLLYETNINEATFVGWIHSAFPRRYRSDHEPIVTYPRPPPEYLDDYLQRFQARRCFYFRRLFDRTQERFVPEVKTCQEADAQGLLRRPLRFLGRSMRALSTAETLGWYDPEEANHERALPAGTDSADDVNVPLHWLPEIPRAERRIPRP